MKLDNPLNLNFSQQSEQHTQALQATPESDHQKIEALKVEVQAKNQQIDAKNKEISELKIKNRQLQAENQETHDRQKLMDEELKKAEAQIELIMELMNKNQEQKQ